MESEVVESFPSTGDICVLKVHTAKDIESFLFYNKVGEAGKAERDVRLEY